MEKIICSVKMRYAFDPTWFLMYTWLQKGSMRSCPAYFCQNCREKAKGGKNQWVIGWMVTGKNL